MPSVRAHERGRRGVAAVSAAAILALGGCKAFESLPFLKSPVDTLPQGSSSTGRGPAYDSAGATRTAIDPAAVIRWHYASPTPLVAVVYALE